VLSVYSDEMMDSLAQQLSRYAREIGERYMPSMKVDTVFMQDRLGRGGDHTPFQLEGFAAVRFSTPNEFYANQHHDTDLLERMAGRRTRRHHQGLCHRHALDYGPVLGKGDLRWQSDAVHNEGRVD